MRIRPHLLAALVILAVLAGFWTRTRVQPLGTYDQPFYLGIAFDLVHHHRFTDGYRFAGGDQATLRPSGMRFTPLYPSLLAAAALTSPALRQGMDCLVAQQGKALACPRAAGPVRPVQFLMLAASLWGVWWCGWRCTGRMRTGWLALALSLATAPLLLLSVDYLMTETISLFLCVLTQGLGMQALEEGWRKPVWLLATGVTLGLAVLARPGFALFAGALPVAGAILAVLARRRAVLGATLMLAAGTALVLLPWIVRNAVVLGRPSLTFGYASHTLVQRLSFDSMGWRTYAMSYVCWLPDGNGLGALLDGHHACDRFGWDDHPDSFYAIGIGPMLERTVRAAGGWDHHMRYLWQTYLLHDPLRQLGWHALVSIPLALRGLYIDHWWGLVLAPLCAAATIRALRLCGPEDQRFLLLSLPGWFMLACNAAIAVNQVRYNLMLIVPFSVAGAMALERVATRRTRSPS